MKLYTLSIKSQGLSKGLSEGILRLEAAGSATLARLQQVLERELRLEPARPYSFWRTGKWHDERGHYGGPGVEGAKHSAVEARLDRLGLQAGDKIAYLHDREAPRLFMVYVAGAREEGGPPAPIRVLEGLPPPEPPDPGVDLELGALAGAVADTMEIRPRPGPREHVGELAVEVHAVALRAVRWAGGDPGRLRELEKVSRRKVSSWLVEAPMILHRLGDPTLAAETAERVAGLCGAAKVLSGAERLAAASAGTVGGHPRRRAALPARSQRARDRRR